ncbi:MAG: SDR family oxidoreductase [Microgenomates group bacterium]
MSKTTSQSALITGCSSGFGFLAAIQFAEAGYLTFATLRDLNSSGAKELEDRNLSNLHILELDVTNQYSIDSALTQIKNHTDSLDVLINNAGFGYIGPVLDFSIEEVQTQFDTNVYGVLRVTKAFLPLLKKAKGTIINLSSINGRVSFPLYGVYSASKFAIETLTESMRFELAPDGVTPVLVEPGHFRTDFGKKRKLADKMGEHTPHGKMITNMLNRWSSVKDHLFARITSSFQDPQRVSNLFMRIAENPSPRLRYLIGVDAWAFYLSRKVLPYSLWTRLLRAGYNLVSKN